MNEHVRKLHRRAMDAAEFAVISRVQGNVEEARRCFLRAFKDEARAARLASGEPGANILVDSAVNLAEECGKGEEALYLRSLIQPVAASTNGPDPVKAGPGSARFRSRLEYLLSFIVQAPEPAFLFASSAREPFALRETKGSWEVSLEEIGDDILFLGIISEEPQPAEKIFVQLERDDFSWEGTLDWNAASSIQISHKIRGLGRFLDSAGPIEILLFSQATSWSQLLRA